MLSSSTVVLTIVIGVYMFLAGLIILTRQKEFISFFNDIIRSPRERVWSGILGLGSFMLSFLLLGVQLTSLLWGEKSILANIITTLIVLALLKSLFVIFAPHEFFKKVVKQLNTKDNLLLASMVYILIAIYLLVFIGHYIYTGLR